MSRTLSQLKLLLWKNFILQKRAAVFTAMELLMPVLLISISLGIMIKMQQEYEVSTNENVYHSWVVDGDGNDLLRVTNKPVEAPDTPRSILENQLQESAFKKGTVADLSLLFEDTPIGRKGVCSFLKLTKNENFFKLFDEYRAGRLGMQDMARLAIGGFPPVCHVEFEIAYTPSNPEIDEMMNIFVQRFNKSDISADVKKEIYAMRNASHIPDYVVNALPFITVSSSAAVTPKHSVKDLLDYMKDSLSSQCGNPLLGAIIFDESFANNVAQAEEVSYTIRLANTRRSNRNMVSKSIESWDTSKDFVQYSASGPVNPTDGNGGSPGYWEEGFLMLQRAVDLSIMEYLARDTNKAGRSGDIQVQLQRFPHPRHTKKIIEICRGLLAMIVLFAFTASVMYTVRSIVMEKEHGLKEYMKVMGLSGWMHWVAFFVVNYVKFLFSVAVLAALLYCITTKSDPSVAFVFFMLYAIDAVCFAFAVSTFFHSGTAGTLGAVFTWMIFFFWLVIFHQLDEQKPFSFGERMALSLNPNVAVDLYIRISSVFEMQGSGVHWNLLFERPSPDEDLTLGHMFCMLIVDALIYLLIMWYVEAVYPGSQGVPQKPYFFALRSYWLPSYVPRLSDEEMLAITQASTKPKFARIEPEPTDVRATVNVVNLSKSYRRGVLSKLVECRYGKEAIKVAVKKLNFKLFHGQITALLGHNGAGKSTTFSMLTGVTAPSSGTAYIDGCDIRTSLAHIRQHLGLCPQYNILFDRMKVMEHLKFFCDLKGREWKPAEAIGYLSRLKMDFKAGYLAGKLSGGQKRKLSLAIALIGGSEIVMLDEPTSGMDPEARHETWTLLQGEKNNRTMLLTTHYMEEADLLGDRIVIMSHGEMQCCGTGMFLKNQYGAGYHLTISKSAEQQSTTSQPLTHRDTLDLIRKHSRGAEILSAIGNEVTFLLPLGDRSKFPALFLELEKRSAEHGIASFGVSTTTMEEVFLKVGEIADARVSVKDKFTTTTTQTYGASVEEDNSPGALGALDISKIRGERRLTGFWYYLQHARAMFIKRFVFAFRKWPQLIIQVVFPIAYLAMMIWASKVFPAAKDQPPLSISLKPYSTSGKPTVIYVESMWFDQNVTLGSSSVNLPKLITSVAHSFDRSTPVSIRVSNDIHRQILSDISKIGGLQFGLHHPVGFRQDVDSNESMTAIVGMFNNFGPATPSLALSLADSAIMRVLFNRNFNFHVTNHPLSPTGEDLLKNKRPPHLDMSEVFIGHTMIIAMSFAVAGFANFLVLERKKKSKHMQAICGLRPWVHWTTTFIYDFTIFVLLVAAFFGVFVFFDLKEYISRVDTSWTIVLVMLLFGFTQIPLVYSASFLFSSVPKAFGVVFLYCFLTGLASAIVMLVLWMVSTESVYYPCSIVFALFFPVFNLRNCFKLIADYEFGRGVCSTTNCTDMKTDHWCCDASKENKFDLRVLEEFSKRGIIAFVLFFIVEGFIFWIVTFLVDYGYVQAALQKLHALLSSAKMANTEPFMLTDANSVSPAPEPEDPDVIKENEYAKQKDPSQVSILVCDLRKTYGKFEAVKGVSFHVRKFECFGLLGVNGAGKTSTFQMLIGENRPTSGDAFIVGSSVSKDWREATRHIGYCPQYDAVIKEMTGVETLFMIARLRGFYEADVPTVVTAVIDAIGIQECAGRQINTYSGGNKRRLSLGMALIGLPEALLLDEPTTGVDPQARRMIWNILSKVRGEGSALVLTSHSMEECEALCTQLAIMVAGRLRCYGSAQHIKSRYGVGNKLLLRLQSPDQAPKVKDEIAKAFPGSILKEEHVSQLNYELPRSEGVRWSSLFETMEALVKRLGIVDYSLSQATLEQVFLDFSRGATLPTAKVVADQKGNETPGKQGAVQPTAAASLEDEETQPSAEIDAKKVRRSGAESHKDEHTQDSA